MLNLLDYIFHGFQKCCLQYNTSTSFYVIYVMTSILRNLYHYFLISCFCHLYISLLICKVVSSLPRDAKAMLELFRLWSKRLVEVIM